MLHIQIFSIFTIKYFQVNMIKEGTKVEDILSLSGKNVLNNK